MLHGGSEVNFKINCESIRSNNSNKMYLEGSVFPMKTEMFSTVAAKSSTGTTIRSVLRRALVEKRITVGLQAAIRQLSTTSSGALFCFTAEAPPGDSGSHMHEVLLQAFCVENDIYVVKVDSADKLRKLIGFNTDPFADYNCVLVHNPYADPYCDSPSYEETLTDAEKDLVDYCEDNWGMVPAPIVKLPEK